MSSTEKTTGERHAALKAMLERRREELAAQMRGKIRDIRADGSTTRDGPDHEEVAGVDTHEDIDFALIQMKSEALHNIEATLHRLAQNNYGNCAECGAEISAARLGALPFAVRCKECEEAREHTAKRAVGARRSSWASLFSVPS